MGERKDQRDLIASDWQRLISAMEAIHQIGVPSPTYLEFIKVHIRAMNPNDSEGMSWHVHSMGRMNGYNFLSWHRYLLVQMERRLQRIDPEITLPYWDATNDPSIPMALSDPALLLRWGITRGTWDPAQLATPPEETDILQIPTFRLFQRTLEGHIHGGVHNAVGGDMAGPASPSDPLFFLHHANIDRLWAVWQVSHPGLGPANLTDTLQPAPLFDVTVAQVQNIAGFGYSYEKEGD